ncbi:PocR ligand-binding domain-containing protein [Acetivibrio clariflavus]|uniref:Response regulator containing CheY-like receiver domain and AraC-type DNA-binding domain n=1 Tax=Acetivibrio clariflavus (strain DSM 19732 / NBRC 101661 / EBR45) TaxID=720554 RepID=G8LVC7_ACECE|nr:PocR ligand-binding domain-containing protein [Acetivibrio clariflavus]AEV67481.1 response regulator containing CheY-like receiver domain and AraC-type DNA-binding domain [Acetivibrio clariflavus DSM 19732]
MNIQLRDTNEITFDLDKAIKSLKAYSQSTGIESFIIDSKGQCIHSFGKNTELCNLCQKLRDNTNKDSQCASVHLYGSYQAERFGGKYIFFCPMGFVHWAAPITVDDTLFGAFIGGPVLMLDPDEFMLNDIIKENGLNDEQVRELNEYIGKVPVIEPERVNNLAELLAIVAGNISKGNSLSYEQKGEAQEIQSDISEWIHYMKAIEQQESEYSTYPLEKEKLLLSKIALGDKQESQKILNEILGYVFFSSGNDFEVIRARTLELIVLLSRAAVEGGANVEEIFGLNYKYLSEIYQYKTVEDLTFWLSKIMARFTDCVFNLADIRHKDTIYKALDYIKRNYANPITLEEVANHVFLNPSYFSKIFKNEMKCTFVAYVNKVRINASKNLLLNNNIPLSDIIALVGFDDQSYFTKVFKKEVGITPGKFRATRGRG